ncbi:MAG: hypothetical protein BAA01_00285 [Bacillus thermozeamaize]|jgi:hypothetical protein|uniref:Uncharacterized protein n=1 Tax=Bacillus thermozeamaize TaxID=230954 RepID=A0A1Y3PV53_9BACI|nr:MAG: hypothetical protein BAA01_00285 [Bacillus thermozeamaize]
MAFLLVYVLVYRGELRISEKKEEWMADHASKPLLFSAHLCSALLNSTRLSNDDQREMNIAKI